MRKHSDREGCQVLAQITKRRLGNRWPSVQHGFHASVSGARGLVDIILEGKDLFVFHLMIIRLLQA